MKKRNLKKGGWRALNTFIIANFLLEVFYGIYQVFFVLLPPDGKKGPLMGKAKDISPDLMTKRRLFAIETWIAVTGLCVYLGTVYREKLSPRK